VTLALVLGRAYSALRMLTDVPNLLTLSRIAAIPLLVALVVIGRPTTVRG
jgi:phosphatidylglycerophosphate synthase